MTLISKYVTVAGLALLLTGTGSFSGFNDFKARLLGTDPAPAVETTVDVDIDEQTTAAVTSEPIETGDATTTVTLTNEFNGESVDQSVSVTETTGGQTVTTTYPQVEPDPTPQQPNNSGSMFTRFKARFSF